MNNYNYKIKDENGEIIKSKIKRTNPIKTPIPPNIIKHRPHTTESLIKSHRNIYKNKNQIENEDNVFITQLIPDFKPHTKYSALNETPDEVYEVLNNRSRQVEAIKLSDEIKRALNTVEKNGIREERPIPYRDEMEVLKEAQVLHFEYGPYYAYLSRVMDYVPKKDHHKIIIKPKHRNKVVSQINNNKRKQELVLELQDDIKNLQNEVETSRQSIEKGMILLGLGKVIPWKILPLA